MGCYETVLSVGDVKGELNVVLFNRVCQNAHSSEYWTCQLTDCGYFQLRCDFCFWFRLQEDLPKEINCILYLQGFISRQFTITIN